jgi:hypothetical protein
LADNFEQIAVPKHGRYVDGATTDSAPPEMRAGE